MTDEEFLADPNEKWEQESGWRQSSLKFFQTTPMEIFMMALTFFALYASDCNQKYSSASGDTMFGIVSLITMFIFLTELVVFSVAKPKYWLGSYFWLDLIAALSLLSDVDFIMKEVVSNQMAAARAGRASRAGTRASRIVRVIRLLRLTRMIRLLRMAKKKKDGEPSESDLEADGEIRAGAVTERLAEFTTAKVIIGLLLMMVFMSLQNTEPADNTYRDALGMLKTNFDAVYNRSSGNATYMPQSTFSNDCDQRFDLDFNNIKGALKSEQLALLDGASFMTLEDMGVKLRLDQPAMDKMYKYPNAAANGIRPLELPSQPGNCTSYALTQALLYDFLDIFPNTLLMKYYGIQLSVNAGQSKYGEELPFTSRIELLRSKEVSHVTLKNTVIPADCESLCECEGVDWCLSVDIESDEDALADSSIWTTTFIIVLLVVGMMSFNYDTNKLSNHITKPMKELCEEMISISKLDFTERNLKPSTVYEIKQMQRAFLQMKVGLCSFAKYAPRDIVVEMLESGKDAELYVKLTEISVLFSHITNFEHLCDDLEALVLLDVLAVYFDAVTDSISNTKGTLLDFIGDMVLAIWNAPKTVENHCCAAIESAMMTWEMLQTVIAELVKDKGVPPLTMSVGINSGNVFVGNTGARARMKYSVLGDGVNLASRIGELNGRYKSTVIMSEFSTLQPDVKKRFLFRNVDCVTVKGKTVGVKVFEVLGRLSEQTTDNIRKCALQDEAMQLYFSRRFEEAVEKFDELLHLVPGDTAAMILRKRCQNFADNPPSAEWDGADVATSKHF